MCGNLILVQGRGVNHGTNFGGPGVFYRVDVTSKKRLNAYETQVFYSLDIKDVYLDNFLLLYFSGINSDQFGVQFSL